MRYPEAERLDLVEDRHGHRIADPYRWLEDPADPATEAWSVAQDGLVRRHLDGLEGRDHLRARLRALMPGVIGAPHVVGDRAFFLERQPEQEHGVFMVVDQGGKRALIDPTAIDPTLTTTLDAAVPSKDGRRVAYLLSEKGRESSVLRVMDADTAEVVDGPIELGRGGAVAWIDHERLVFVRCRPDAPEGEEQFHRRVCLHQVGADPAQAEVLFGEGRDKTTYYGLHTSRDGRWLTVSAWLGTAPRDDLYLCDLADGRQFVVVQEGVDASTTGGVHRDGRLYLQTDREAPKGRLVVTDPATPTVEHWQDVLAETDDVLADVTITDDAVVAVRTRDVVSVVTVHDRHTGSARYDVDLPGPGVATVTSRADGGDDVWIGYTDYVTPYEVLHHRVGPSPEVTVWATAPGAVEIPGVRTHRVFYRSADGTRIPMFVVARDDVARPAPTILYGYGGFNITMAPAYAASIAAWVEVGGVWAVACLRGGSEYGEEWHRAGMRANKQNVFDDFIAAGEWLHAEGWATPERMAISGGSNGGLLVGATLTQRPDLCAAVVCSAPLLDMVRYELTGLGQTWNDEYGRADDPEELGWLLGYSPYHHVAEGTAYPAVLFTVFDGDTRVDPFHARKLCAALQHATTSDPARRPVLIRRETDVGHGARAVSRHIELSVDTFSFLAHHTGLGLG